MIFGADMYNKDYLSSIGESLAQSPPDMTPLITRQMLWDMTPHCDVPEALQNMDMTLGADDGYMIEHMESDNRLNMIAPMSHAIVQLAKIAGKIYTSGYFEGGDDDDPEFVEEFAEQAGEILTAGTVAIITQLISVGALVPTMVI